VRDSIRKSFSRPNQGPLEIGEYIFYLAGAFDESSLPQYAGHGNENEPGLKNALITKTCLDFAVDLPMPANTIIDGGRTSIFCPN